MVRPPGLFRAAALAAAALLPALAASPAASCRLALALALDISSSVSAEEDRLQRQGLAAALAAPEVAEAFFATPDPVALAVYEWSGRMNQELLLDWRLIDSPAALASVARQLGESRRSHNDFETAIGYALRYGARLLARAPGCGARVIDLSGDGANNDGPGPRIVYGEPGFAGITVNGLVINAADFEGELNLIAYFEREVLHGPGAFSVVAQGFEDYERALRIKLQRELAPGFAIGARARAQRPG